MTAAEAAFLLWLGESPAQVCAILQMSPAAVSKACRERGDAVTAQVFEAWRLQAAKAVAA